MKRAIDREAAEALANLASICPSLHRPIAEGMAALRDEAAHYRVRLKEARSELDRQTTDRQPAAGNSESLGDHHE